LFKQAVVNGNAEAGQIAHRFLRKQGEIAACLACLRRTGQGDCRLRTGAVEKILWWGRTGPGSVENFSRLSHLGNFFFRFQVLNALKGFFGPLNPLLIHKAVHCLLQDVVA